MPQFSKKDLQNLLEAYKQEGEKGGYKKGIEDAADFVRASPSYFADVGQEERLAADIKLVFLGVKVKD